MLNSAFPAGNGELRVVEIGAVALQSGVVLPGVSLALQCWGTPTADRDNIVLVEHALTGDSHLVGPANAEHPTPGWWDGLVGPGAPLDTDEWCVVAINALGGCRGSTGPASAHPSVGDPEGSSAWPRRAWGSRFPSISIRDQVAAEALLLDRLGVRRVAAVIGGSMGAMRALEWMIGYPERVAAALVLAVGPRATADQIGTQITQIAAITSDPDWQGGDYHGTGRAPVTGMGIARRIAHLTYRTAEELDARFGNAPQTGEDPRAGGRYAVQSYLDHQVAKFARRFDPGTYVVLSEAMNRHDVGFGRGGVTAALRGCAVPCLVGGIDSDRLYPLATQQELADQLAGCERLEIIHSPYGHDGFLLEFAAMSKLLAQTMNLARANK